VSGFRFGVVESGSTPWSGWGGLVRRVADAGYDTVQVAHHPSLATPPPLLALAAAAETAPSLTLGTLVIDANHVTPEVLAGDSAWLAARTGGRVELGLGAGWLADDAGALGARMRPAAERVERLGEVVREWRACWDRAAGSAGPVHGIPPGTPRPRLLLGGGGARVLGIAAEHADVVSIAPDMRSGRIGSASARTATLPEVRERVERVLARRSGPAPELHTTLTAVLRRDDDERLHRTARAFDVAVGELDTVPGVLVGGVDEMADQVRALHAATGIGYLSVPTAHLDDVAPVVAALRDSA
jgi:probable F420-dependent oxidoreductase